MQFRGGEKRKLVGIRVIGDLRVGLILGMLSLWGGGWPWIRAGDDLEGWKGIWRIGPADTEQGPAMLHVLVGEGSGGPSVVYYNPDFFKPFQARDVVLEGATLRFHSATGSKEFDVRLERQGQKVTGEWILRHPQFRSKEALIGYRVTQKVGGPLAEALWDLAREEGFVSLAGELCRLGRDTSWEDFLEAWDARIAPTYYLILQDIVYDRGASPSAWQQRVRTLYDWVQVPENCRAVERFEASHRELIQQLKKQASSWGGGPLVVVDAVVGEGEAVRFFGTNQVVILRLALDSEEFGKTSTAKGWLACQHLMSPLYGAFPWVDQGVVARVVRTGVAAYAATALGLADRPEACLLGEGEGTGDLAAAKEKIARAVKFRPAEKEVDPPTVLQVGYDFARQVASTYTLESLPQVDRGRFSELLASYLGLQ